MSISSKHGMNLRRSERPFQRPQQCSPARETAISVLLFLCWSCSAFMLQAGADSVKLHSTGILWQESPVLSPPDSAELHAKAGILYDFRQYNYFYNDYDELVLEYTEHNLIRVHSLAGVEEYNKFAIPLSKSVELVDLKARSIAPDGAIMDLSEQSIRELGQGDHNSSLRIFAIEGLVPGGAVEYAYTIRQEPRFYGREVFQRDIPVGKAVFEIIAPSNLYFESRSYAGLPAAADSSLGIIRLHQMIAEQMPAAYSERYALYQPALQRLEFKMTANAFSGPGQLFSWEKASHRYRELVYSMSKDDVKMVKTLLKRLKIKKLESSDEAIRTIESYLKENLTFLPDEEGGPSEHAAILRSGYASELGMLRMHTACLAMSSIAHSVVVGADREGFPFDPDFESWTYLEEPFLYFPHSEKYLSPSSYAFRYGTISHSLSGTKALYIAPPGQKENSSQGMGYWIDSVPEVPLADHYDDLDIVVRLSEDLASAELQIERRMSGHRAMILQPYLHLLTEESRGEIAREILLNSGPNADLMQWEYENDQMQDIYDKRPLVLKGQLNSRSLMERAGKSILLKVGDLIGPQVEMYQSGPRRLDIDVQYPHGYRRSIELLIPDGYQLKGQESLDQELQFNDEQGRDLMGFISQSTLKDQRLIIDIHEYYRSTSMPASRFDDFRQVINAAADFNKVVLILEPELRD